LVKGKSGWRIGSVEALGNPFMAAPNRRARGSVAYVVKQVRRFVHGEQPLGAAFTDLEACLEAVTHERCSAEQSDMLVQVTVFRLLHALGYIGDSTELQHLLVNDMIADHIPQLSEAHAQLVATKITQAGAVSHL
jgi:hypothetical protein